ncbi:putative ABC transport system permease protein [Breznakia sp. PF5-3]|uniref:ABC transporter permease n=1 Tax=unclassified Breznakia TaxID=2623764 RepID=UPI002407208C|nr:MULTISPECIES: ABC transporter permease [unclassified Breznakia]MDF9825603.1 putative ABC transport system permease protein [Breznakia sp. PM6-1]MDF9835858.1 putative ABC transport system permease protein [Breznakia sp. PF5-3]MDF9837603.1 putative ABC transport system permease protein [Breznakia sp. PFB2-8]MDF9860016.1 putative ABC transport system permease protein [Breznakia sp. PH5-24]
MYIIKNAIRNIWRTKGKNILIVIIVFIIGLSCCIALSIKQAAQNARDTGLDKLNITATIQFDRQQMMQEMQPPEESDDSSAEDMREKMRDAMANQNLSLKELQTYAKADSVKDFYYTSTISMNGNDNLQAINSNNSIVTESGPSGERESIFSNSDFMLIGYSSYDAMSDFNDETKTIKEGALFSMNNKNEAIISEDLATYNSIKLNDTITLVNPNNTKDTHTLKVVGIYTSTSENGPMMSDPANQIYTNIETTNTIINASSLLQANIDDATELNEQISGTYVFKDIKAYEAFEKEAKALGLSDEYTIESNDVALYEQSLQPLENLANYANTFLYIILVVGGIILIVFNLLRIKERKYEIGVLSAIGMNRKKVSFQFITELFIITMFSMLLAIGIGSVTSVPITNSLLANEITNDTMEAQMPEDMQGGGRSMPQQSETLRQGGPQMENNTNYIQEVSSATDFSVIIKLFALTIILTILSSGIATLTILRYDPLKILSNRE